MTHAESSELLLDLAFGELPPERARELEAHLAGCPECQREKAALDEARRLSAPLRELEEPSAGFDDRILAAARAQAQLDHEGSIGQVIEVKGSVQPLTVEAARIDAHARPAVREERRRPRWALRVALGGSVAAAAVLALVVSTSLQTRQAAERAAQQQSGEGYQIRVRAPEEEAAREAPEAPAPAPAAAPAAAGAKTEPAPEPAKRAASHAPKKKERPGEAVQGSGGDGLDLAQPAAPPPPAPAPAAQGPAPAAQGPAAGALKSVAVAENAQTAAVAQAMEAKVSPASAAALEIQAQSARHAGDYARAAALYRAAAGAPRDAGAEPAAWNLAHAVECYAAAGMFDAARQVRDQLARTYPAEKTAFAAAARALREVDAPGAASRPEPQPAAAPDR